VPSIRQSARVNLGNWKPVEDAPQTGTDKPPLPPPKDGTERSPFMLTSMPLMASTGDAFQKQFYGAGNAPQQRILPAKKGAGA
jgi:hypothetical protein